MKIQQLFDLIKEQLKINNDLEVVVMTPGIGGSHSKVTGFYEGFDWYTGKLVLRTESNLSKVDSNLHSFYRNQYLDKISNIRNVRAGKTLVARFKKEEKSFERQYEAELWLNKKLNEFETKGDWK